MPNFNNMHPENFIKHLIKPIFNTLRTRQIFKINPTLQPVQHDAASIRICVYDYNNNSIKEVELKDVAHLVQFKNNNNVSWINIDGLKKADIEAILYFVNLIHFGPLPFA